MRKDRLLNVARALRESPNPDRFTMASYAHSCNTPACAFGHYACRPDLQDEFVMSPPIPNIYRWMPALKASGEPVTYDCSQIRKHFGIDYAEAEELFSDTGCGYAETALEAAEYFERFVAGDEVDE